MDTPRGIRRRIGVDSLCRVKEVFTGVPSYYDEDYDGLYNDIEEVHEEQYYHYDELGRLITTQQKNPRYGQSVAGFDRYGEFAEKSYLYDALDRLVQITYPDGQTVLWEYDAEGNVTKMTDTQGKVTEYSYYRDNLLYQVTLKRAGQSDRVFTYTYDDAGRLEEIVYPTGTGITAVFRDENNTSGSGFDPNGNLRFLRYEKSGVADPIRSFEWTYDDADNRQSMLDVDPARAVKWEYEFDWLDRLIKVKAAESTTGVQNLPATALLREYVFDESDNRTFLDDYVNNISYHYKYKTFDDNGTTRYSARRSRYKVQLEEVLIYAAAAGHRNIGDFVSHETFEYDADGNMTKRILVSTSEEISFTWSEFDRLQRVQSDQHGRKQDARYDVDGLRERKLDKNGNSSQEYGVGVSTSTSKPLTSSSAAPTISYISGHMILGAEIDGQFVYFLNDALSTVRDLVSYNSNSSQWEVLRSYEFDEYGNALPGSGNGTRPNSPKTFVGGLSVNDDTADSGLFNMGHRNYAAGVLGRFISRDPIGHAGNLNLYAYPTNPVNAVDPSGLDGIGQAAMKDYYQNTSSTISPANMARLNQALRIINRYDADLQLRMDRCSDYQRTINPGILLDRTLGSGTTYGITDMLTGTVYFNFEAIENSYHYEPVWDPNPNPAVYNSGLTKRVLDPRSSRRRFGELCRDCRKRSLSTTARLL